MQAAEAGNFLDALDRKSRRVTTPATPQGNVVWRSWGDGPPLALLHGGAGSWMHWVQNIDTLARTHTLWVPDLPGMGDSDLPREGLDADSIAPIVLDGLNSLLKGEAFDLIGFSFGAVVSGFVAQLAQEKVKRLILTAGTGIGLHMGPRHELRSLRGVTDPAGREEVLRSNLAAMMIHDVSHIDGLAIEVQARSAQRDRVRGRTVARTDAMIKLAPQWKCPTYGIWGADDNARHQFADSFDDGVEKLGLRETHIIPDAGHWVMFEQPAAYHALVTRMLTQAGTDSR